MIDANDIMIEFENIINSIKSLPLEVQKMTITKMKSIIDQYANSMLSFSQSPDGDNKSVTQSEEPNESAIHLNDSHFDSDHQEMVIDVDVVAKPQKVPIRRSQRFSNRTQLKDNDIHKNKSDKHVNGSCLKLNNNKNKDNELRTDYEQINNLETRISAKEVIEKSLKSNNKKVTLMSDDVKSMPTAKLDSNEDKRRNESRISEKSDNKPKRRWRRAKNVDELTCKECGKMWRSLSHLEIHMRSHTGEKKYTCDDCGRRFVQLAGLQVHIRRHKNERPFKCEKCEKAFYTKIDLTRHQNSHQDEKKICSYCEMCGKGFSDNRRLKNHIRFVHEKKDSVVCEICGHKTHGQHLLYAHKRVKHGEVTKHACPICNIVIGSRNAFIIHMRAHADIRPCSCDICGKRFRSSSQVARHKLAHQEGRHECDLCLKKFKTPHHLRRHKVIHSGLKPFQCHLCEYRCNVNSNIVKHVKSVHGLLNFSLSTEHKRILKPGEEEALQKGTLVAEEILKLITKSKGEQITLNSLKQIEEEKKKEKDLIISEISNNFYKKKLTRRQLRRIRKEDILDDAIASTLNDSNTSHSIETDTDTNSQQKEQADIEVQIEPMPTYQSVMQPEYIQSQVVISSSLQNSQIYQISSNRIKSNSNNEEQHYKDIITLHFAN